VPYKDAETQRAYQRDYGRLRRAGETQTPRQTLVPTEFRLKTAADVIALLEEQVGAVREDTTLGTVERARTIGYLASIALKAIDTGDLAARLEALEMVLRTRKQSA
jgi:hypothetical protein